MRNRVTACPGSTTSMSMPRKRRRGKSSWSSRSIRDDATRAETVDCWRPPWPLGITCQDSTAGGVLRLRCSGVAPNKATRDLLRDRFLCELRGVIDVKGKGKMETWFLER